MKFIYRLHAIERMFQRDISEAEVEETISNGSVIEFYENDKPYPSYLTLKHFDNKTLHVVYAKDDTQVIIIITVYEPDPTLWNNDFTKRLK